MSMNLWTVASRGLRHYWRTNAGVALGSALGALVLTGALLVGDSVKGTLVKQALARVGQVQSAAVTGDKFATRELAERLGQGTAGALALQGSATRADGKARINALQILGVDPAFWALSPGGTEPNLQSDEAALNARAAEQLGVKVGDTLVLRVEKPGAFSRDAPLSGEENEVIAIRLRVSAIVSDAQFGRFSLQASQVAPFTAFVDLKALHEKLGAGRPVNLFLSRSSDAGALQQEIENAWQIADAALQVRDVPSGGVELRTSRVFLDPPVVQAAPDGVDGLTYLVNEIQAGDHVVPYSMVTALDAPSSGFLPAELADDEIAISQWLADDLGITHGAKVRLKYFVMGERRALEERTREFTVLHIVPMDEPELNSSWMPDFPGLSDKANCREWEPGFALDLSKIRDKDEQYWDQHKGTPKAFVNIMVGQEMWGNRWGNLTTVRYPREQTAETVAAALKSKLTPQQIGFSFIPLRQQALAATQAPVDFGQLFLSFSGFLLIAAAVLTGLLFVFSIEQRQEQAGLLLALGWPAKKVRQLFMLEGAVLAVTGASVGALGGFVYNAIVLRALSSVWKGATGGVAFEPSFSPATLAIGILASAGVALLAMWLASRRQLRHTARELLSAAGQVNIAAAKQVRVPVGLILGAMLALAGIACLVAAPRAPGSFFGAGALLLLAALAFARTHLAALARGGSILRSAGQLGIRNAARRRGRSMATIAVLASGVFMVLAVDAFRKRDSGAELGRDSGTGGFALIGESALPIYEDLNSAGGRETYGLDGPDMADVALVPMRVRAGDDASCLNLNRALQPRLLGVKPAELASRGAFRFAQRLTPEFSWEQLSAKVTEPNTTLGVVDDNTLQWALQMNLGDIIEYRDERGNPLKVMLVASVAGSVLQGNVLIAEEAFTTAFPQQSGYQYFLIDAPSTRASGVAEKLTRALADRGFQAIPVARQLAAFHEVENTYLSIFQALGGLGLLLGTAGLAIVVARNVLERRVEFGLLEAVGFRKGQLRGIVFAEHAWLIAWGLAAGAIGALVTVCAAIAQAGEKLPVLELSLLLAALALGSVLWTWLATLLSLRGRQIDAIRSE